MEWLRTKTGMRVLRAAIALLIALGLHFVPDSILVRPLADLAALIAYVLAWRTWRLERNAAAARTL